MAEKIWSGGNGVTAQFSTITPSALSTAASVINVQLESWDGLTHTISYTAASTAVDAAIAGIVAAAVAAKAGSADGWADVTTADSTTVATVTADTAGNPFVLTASIGSGPGSTATSVLTANTGPSIFLQAENWVGDVAPVDGDSIRIPATALSGGSIYGIDSTADQYQGFDVENGCPLNIGSLNKKLHVDLKDSATYYDASLGCIGTAFLEIDNYNTIDIFNASPGSPADGDYGTNITGTHDADDTNGRGTIFVRVGLANSVSLGGNAGESLKANKINIRSGTVKIGDTVTSSTTATALPIEHENGTLGVKSAVTTLDIKQGLVTREGSGVVGTVDVQSGTFFDNGSGTITNTYVRGGAALDASGNTLGATYSSTNLWAGATFKDPHQSITFTSDPILNKCGLPGSEGASLSAYDLGSDIRVGRASI